MKTFTTNILSYEEARKQIKNGDIVFVSGSSTLIGKLIQFVTRSPIYHVGIATWMTTPWGERILFSCEQWYGGRRLVNLRTYTGSSLVVVSSPIVNRNFAEYADELIKNTGHSYGYLDFIGAGVHSVTGRDILDTSGEICSEIIMRIINEHLKLDLPTLISPAELFELLIKEFDCKVKLQTRKEK